MPVYTFECGREDCGQREDVVMSIHEDHGGTIPCHCGGTKTRIFTAPQVSCFTPYTTREITGDPIVIKSPGQENEICRRHGVERVSTSGSSIPTDKATRKRRLKSALSRMPSWNESVERAENDVKYKQVPEASDDFVDAMRQRGETQEAL